MRATMLRLRTGAPPACPMRGALVVSNACLTVSPVHRAFVQPCRHFSSNRIATRVAATEPQTSNEAAPVSAYGTADEPSAARPISQLDPAVAEELDAEELDQQQETLLKWMLYNSDQQQEDDLDEMIDYTEFGDDEYEELYEELDDLYDQHDYDFQLGSKVMGTVIEVDDNGAYIDVGAKGSAFMPTQEASFARLKTALEVVRPGMKREFVVVGDEDEYGQLIVSLGAMECTTFWARIRQLQEEDIVVYVTVESANRGGLLVKYGQYEGFIPVSQFGPQITLDAMENLVGYDIPAKFLEVDEEGERLVFSNRRASGNQTEVHGFTVGQVVAGVVQSVKPYGAFVDLGGVTGLLHVSQISHERIASVDKILSEGDKLKVMILSVDRDRGRMTLSTKKLEPTPGDMLRDPQLVYEMADQMAEAFRTRVRDAESMLPEGPIQDNYVNEPMASGAEDQGSFIF